MKPRGAEQLEQMRHTGKRPMGPIFVTESPDIAKNARQRGLYPLLFDPEKTDDWRALRSLDVHLLTKLDRPAVASVCMAIADANPSAFYATYFGKYEIEHDTVIHATPR